jgi:hypothetical protein
MYMCVCASVCVGVHVPVHMYTHAMYARACVHIWTYGRMDGWKDGCSYSPVAKQ